MANTRYVRQGTDGHWQLLEAGQRRASVQSPTRQAAIRKAEMLVSNGGGGEVHVLNAAGKIEKAIRVTKAPKKSAA